MTFGPDEAAGARITSLDDYNKCLDYFQKEGYNEVDTARAYINGAQEAWSKEAHWQDRGLTLATKCYPREPGTHKPEVLKASLLKSLSELGTECVDIFYLHAADRSVPFAETLEVLNELHKEGKFVQLGLSNFTAFEVAEVVITCKERGWVRPTIYQGMYNAISKHFGLITKILANGHQKPVPSNKRRFLLAIDTVLTSSSIIHLQEASSLESTKARTCPRKAVTATLRHRAPCTAIDISKTLLSMRYVSSSQWPKSTT